MSSSPAHGGSRRQARQDAAASGPAAWARRGGNLARSLAHSSPAAVRDRPDQAAGTGEQGTGSGRNRVAEVGRSSALNLAAAAISAIATTGITIVVTRQFPKTEAGTFFTATSAFLIIGALASLGTNVGLTYFIARLLSLGQARRIQTLMRAAITPVIVASAVSAVLLALLAGPLAHLLLVKGHAQQQTGMSPAAVTDTLRALALALPFAGLLNAHLGASRGYGDMRPTATVGQIGLSVGRLIGVGAAAALGSAALLAPLWALPYIPAAVIAWLWGRRISHNRIAPRPVPLPDVPPELAALLALSTPVPTPDRPVNDSWMPGSRAMRRQLANANPRGFWLFTIPRAIANLAQNILQQIDIVLVAAIRGPAEAAVYTAATRFLVIGQLGNMAINRASQTRFTEVFTLGNRRAANTIYRVTTTWLVLLLWPLYLLAIVYGPTVLAVFGHSYRAGDTVVVILGLAMLIATVCGQVDMVLITSGRSSWSLANGLMTVGVNIGVDVALIPRYGITGAAIGWAVAIVISNLLPLAQLAKVLRLHPFSRGSITACLLSGISFGVIPFAARTALGGGAFGIAAGVAAGCALQAAGLWRLRGPLRLTGLPGFRAKRGGRPARAN